MATQTLGTINFGPLPNQTVNTLNPCAQQAIIPAVAASVAGSVITSGGTSAWAILAGETVSTGIINGLNPTGLGTLVSQTLTNAGANATISATAGVTATSSLQAAASTSTSPSGVLTIDGQQVNMGDDYLPSDYDGDYGPLVPNFDPTQYIPQGTALKRIVPIAYTVNGQTASICATIYKQPLASFTAYAPPSATGPGGSVTLVFDFSGSYDYDTVIFNFGDGTTATIVAADNPDVTTIEHTYTNITQGTYSVLLTALNENIQGVSVQVVSPIGLASS
jgi:hypothetical protein